MNPQGYILLAQNPIDKDVPAFTGECPLRLCEWRMYTKSYVDHRRLVADKKKFDRLFHSVHVYEVGDEVRP